MVALLSVSLSSLFSYSDLYSSNVTVYLVVCVVYIVVLFSEWFSVSGMNLLFTDLILKSSTFCCVSDVSFVRVGDSSTYQLLVGLWSVKIVME